MSEPITPPADRLSALELEIMVDLLEDGADILFDHPVVELTLPADDGGRELARAIIAHQESLGWEEETGPEAYLADLDDEEAPVETVVDWAAAYFYDRCQTLLAEAGETATSAGLSPVEAQALAELLQRMMSGDPGTPEATEEEDDEDWAGDYYTLAATPAAHGLLQAMAAQTGHPGLARQLARISASDNPEDADLDITLAIDPLLHYLASRLEALSHLTQQVGVALEATA